MKDWGGQGRLKIVNDFKNFYVEYRVIGTSKLEASASARVRKTSLIWSEKNSPSNWNLFLARWQEGGGVMH